MDLNIIDFNLSTMSDEYKREFFYKLDLTVKRLHQSGSHVSNFDPNFIYIDEVTHLPYFKSLRPFKFSHQSESDLKKADLLLVANLAFCTYLPEYNLRNGLLNSEVISERFEDFKGYFPTDDVAYYQSVFQIDYFDANTPIHYYSDYINQKMNDSGISQEQLLSYTKSTEAGRALKDEAGYANYIFITCIVFSLLLLGSMAILYFIGFFA